MVNNLLILYNPYYQDDVIKQHLNILLKKGEVAFGKVKSKLNNQRNERSILNEIYNATSDKNPLQLFLSDYANLFVAKVKAVVLSANEDIIPDYYRAKKLEVENYFIISDLRELVREDFSLLRDRFLANFTTANNHTYAIYGNNYTYPLIVKQKEQIRYFDEGQKYYINIYKSKEYLDVQENFIRFVFGKRLFYLLHPDSIMNLISAELELIQNEQDILYDFTSIIVKYSKVVEHEVYIFAQKIFIKLCQSNQNLLDMSYRVQGQQLTLKDFFHQKPNLGSIKFLLKHSNIQKHLEAKLKNFINGYFASQLSFFQNIRNKAVHIKTGELNEAYEIRNMILGIEKRSFLKEVLLYKEHY